MKTLVESIKMTTPKPTPEKQNLPEAPDSEETRPNPADATGFLALHIYGMVYREGVSS